MPHVGNADMHVILDAFDTSIYCPWTEVRRDAARAVGVDFGRLENGYVMTQEARNTGIYSNQLEEMAAVLRAVDLSPRLGQRLAESCAILAYQRSHLYEDVGDFAEWCRGQGITLSLLSNCSPSSEPAIAKALKAGAFDQLTLSYKIGCRKPSAEAYLKAAKNHPERVTLLVDDNPEFCRGAIEVGFLSVQITRSNADKRYCSDKAYTQVRSLRDVCTSIEDGI